MKKWLLISWLIAMQWSLASAQDNAAPSPQLPQRSFSTLPQNAGFLQNSVNLFTGQVQFAMPVVSIAGKSGLSYALNLTYASGKVKVQAGLWNREVPTSIVGLGWNLDVPRIIVDNKGTGTREDDTFYLLDGGSSNELFYDGLDGTEWKFYPKAYQFWKIRYNPGTETWTITKDDGVKHIYGGSGNPRKTVQYLIKYGNWIGDSNLATGQSRQVYAWNLAEIVDLWGDNLTFEYLQDTETMRGTLTHTKASYLKEIRNAIGERISLTYMNKLYNEVFPGTAVTVKEYQDPHVEVVEPDAFQERFESKYLDKITTYLSSGQTAESFQLSYDVLGANELAKRLLKSIQRFSFIGASSPPVAFAYETNPVNNYGGLLNLTLPTKGTVSFTYTIQNAASTSDDLTIPGVGTYFEPKVWFTDDYVVLSRRNFPVATPRYHSTDDLPVILDVCTWENGKWIRKSLGPDYNTTGTLKGVFMNDIGSGPLNFQKFDLVTGKDFFATVNRRGDIHSTVMVGMSPNTYYGRYDLNIFKRNPNVPGEWFHYHEEFEDVFTYYVGSNDFASTIPTLLAGDDFILLGGRNKLFKVYDWNGSTWTSWTQNLSTNGERDYFYTAGHNYFVVHDEDETANDDLDFHYKNKANQWSSTTVPANFNSEYSGSSHWHASNTSFVGLVDDNTDYIWSWDENYANFTRFSIGLGDVSNGSPVTNTGSLVGLQQIQNLSGNPTERAHGFRYNGQTWIGSGGVWGDATDYTCSSSLAVGNDYFLTGLKYKRFDANTGTWNADYALASVPGATAKLAAPNFFLRELLYTINPNGTLSGQSVAVVIGGYQWTTLAGADFLVSTNWPPYNEPPLPADIYYKTIKNGVIVDHGYQHGGRLTAGFACSNDQEYPSRLVGSNAFLTARNHVNFTGWLEDAYTFLLSRRLKEGELSDYVVSRVTTFDGSNSQHTSYVYDVASSTVHASGQNFQFNKVTTIAGSDNPAMKPNGSTETYFFNGKYSSELSTDASFPGKTGVSALVTNVNTYLNKFTGLPYKVIQRNAGGTSISETTTDYYVYLHNQSSDQSAYYVRPWYTIASSDGRKIQTYNTFDASTKQLKSEQVTSIGTNGTIVQIVVNDFTYWWEMYEPARTSNLLTPSISKRTTVDGVLTSVYSTRWTTLNGTPCALDSYSWIGPTETGWYWTSTQPSANWEFVSKVNLREPGTGVALQNENQGGRFNATIWDENSRLPLARVENATYSDVAYCGFEDSSKGTLNFTGGTNPNDAKTGSKCYSLGTTGITKGNLSEGTKYQVSFWVKSNGGTILLDGILNPVSISAPVDWTLMTFEVTGLTSLSIRKSGTPDVLLDDLRIHPAAASMTTSVYHPVYGKVSDTDARNKTVYYEYDNTGKLKFVRDDEKNIVKHSLQNFKD